MPGSAPLLRDDRHADLLSAALRRLFGELDEAAVESLAGRMHPVRLLRGEALYREGDAADSLHVLLTGRLQVRVQGEREDGRLIATMEPGEAVGEMALFTGGRRTATVVAARDCALAMLTREAFDEITGRHPQAVVHSARLIVTRLTDAQRRREQPRPLRSLALVPLHASLDMDEFARRLQLALLRFGSVAALDARTVQRTHGLEEGVSLGRFLDEVEARHDFVLYQAEFQPSEWTRRCIGYADRILLVGRADGAPEPGPVERELSREAWSGLLPERDLVLVHPDASRPPAGTRQWLAAREVERHFHVPWAGNAGFNRLARILANRAVALVLAGGGARGFSHIGTVRALREAGVPIDVVGGTSFGALVAATVALGFTDERILDEFKVAFADNRPMDDYTLPVVSIVRGQKLVRALRRHLGEVCAEDCWLPYFAVSANLSQNRQHVHERGELWRAVRASVSLPAIFPPVVHGGDLLVDGGVINNLPVDVMRERVSGRIIAADLWVDDEFRVEDEDLPSGLEYVRARLRGRRRQLPTLARVVIKTTTLGSSKDVAAARRTADLYLNPPVGEFDLLDWERFHAIVEVGYRYARERVAAWVADNPGAVQRDELFDSRARRAGGAFVPA